MLVSFSFRLEVYCAACRMTMPVNGVVASVTCYHCGEVHALDAAWWHRTITPDRLGEPYFDGPQELSRPNELELKSRVWEARCEACKGRSLDLVALVQLACPVSCPECGRAIHVRAPDDLARAIDPHVVLLVGESHFTDDPRGRPIVFACAACGAALTVDGSARTVTCGYCEASNYLPDGLWRQLNPVPKAANWYFVTDYDDAALRKLRWRERGRRFADAMSVLTPPDELALLAADADQGVRLAVAKNATTPAATLAQLATDRDADVARCARRE